MLGERSLSTADVDALAELPPRDQLLAQIAGLFEAPLAQTASVLEALLRDTVGLVGALIDKQGGEPEDAPSAEVPVEEAPARRPAVPEAATTDAEVSASDEVTSCFN